MIILIDSREKDLHILKRLESKKIKYEIKKLDYGDYSFKLGDTSYEKKIVIERKKTFDELIKNLTKDKERFAREFRRSKRKSYTVNGRKYKYSH